MKFNLFGKEFDVDLPADPIGFVKSKVIEILNAMGYSWPSTDAGILRAWASRWDGLQAELQGQLDELEAGIRHLQSRNEGGIPDAVAGYFRSDESAVHSLSTIVDAAPIAAAAYRAAAFLVDALKAYVIGQIILDAVSIAAAILSGGATAAVSFLAKQGAKALIDLAINQVITELTGGAEHSVAL